MIILDYRDTRPLYEQIVDKFQTLILKGVLEPNAKMPSVRSLAVELSINPNTIQRAYSELERTGFIYAVKGRGNFVSYDESLKQVRREEIFQRLDALAEEALELGMTRTELSDRLLAGKGAQTAQGKRSAMLSGAAQNDPALLRRTGDDERTQSDDMRRKIGEDL